MNRKEKMLSFSNAGKDLDNALREFPKEIWAYKPKQNAWSINEILVHLADSEAQGYVRLRKLIAEPNSMIYAYDQDVWAKTLQYEKQDSTLALISFKFLRASNAEMLTLIEESTWNNTVTHSEYGQMNIDDWLDRYERHVHLHIFQMYRNLKSWEEQAN